MFMDHLGRGCRNVMHTIFFMVQLVFFLDVTLGFDLGVDEWNDVLIFKVEV